MRLIDADKLSENIKNGPGTNLQKFFADCCVAAAQEVNPYEWISVDDRLPEKNQDVLCCTSDKDDQPFIGYRDQYCGHWCKGRFDYTWGKITHWMPLPAPPSKKGE